MFINPLNYKTQTPELDYKPPQLRNPPPAIKKCCVVLCCICVSLQRERNCSYYDRFKLQRERETAATTTASSLQRERSCTYYDRFRCAEREKLQLQTASTAKLRLRFSNFRRESPRSASPLRGLLPQRVAEHSHMVARALEYIARGAAAMPVTARAHPRISESLDPLDV